MAFLERKGYVVMYQEVCSPSISHNRNDAVRVARDGRADWLFFVDDDMVFDEDMIHKILEHNLDICGGLCVRKTWPYDPAVGIKVPDQPGVFTQICNFGDDVLFECDAIGTAFLGIKMTVFDKMKKPYFAMPPTRLVLREEALLKALGEIEMAMKDANGDIADIIKETRAALDKADETVSVSGEDIYWCHKAQEAGFKLWCDTVAMIGHLGEYPYSYMDTLRAKERVEAEGGTDERFAEAKSGESAEA
jgi:glycosyltransferase involved in cell wall biosynthesis